MARNREIEIKLPVPNVAKILARLRTIGADRIERVYECNSLFDTPDGQLRRLSSILRIRCERNCDPRTGRSQIRGRKKASEGLLTFKGPIPEDLGLRPGYKERQEIEFRLRNAARFERVLRRIGLRPWFQYEKYRTKYCIHGPELQIDLDETPIGVFLELEGSRVDIDWAAKALGYSKSDYITASYFELYAARCSKRRLKVTNMVFQKKKNH